jgi:hypothetical protein
MKSDELQSVHKCQIIEWHAHFDTYLDRIAQSILIIMRMILSMILKDSHLRCQLLGVTM